MSTKPNVFFRLLGGIWSVFNGVRKVLHFILLFALFAIIVRVMSPPDLTLPTKAALVVAPQGVLTEQLSGTPFDRALADATGDPIVETLVRDLVDAIEYAADDDAIELMYLRADVLAGGDLTKLRTVVGAIDRFRASGKKVIAYGGYFSQSGYYLAAHADEVILDPSGIVIADGFASYRNYYAEAIEKLSVTWNIFKVGTHKSFIEPYTRSDMSDYDREQRTRLIGAIWTSFKDDIEARRELEPGTLQRITDNIAETLRAVNGDFGEFALQNGMVDELATASDVRQRLIGLVGPDEDDEGTFAQVGFQTYVNTKRALDTTIEPDDAVAIVVASGSIIDGSAPPGQIGGDSTAKLLRQARLDDDVKAVVLRVDSGGGSAFASEVISTEIRNLQAAGKPIIASMGGVAASGGYWISMAADHVVAQENTITGSIGIFGMFPTFENSLARLGVYTDGVGTTEIAGALRADKALTPQIKDVLQQNIEHGYRDFVGGVAKYRGMEFDAVDRVAQGQVWMGPTALSHGLVDSIGTLDDAVALAAESAGLETDAFSVRYVEPQLSEEEQLLMSLLDGSARLGINVAPLMRRGEGLGQLERTLEDAYQEFARFNDPMHRYADCFCKLEF
ncbi:MAG: signal peptide peptidase SppA [Pseudomonadota bacterium]